jgi:hypothetical protein
MRRCSRQTWIFLQHDNPQPRASVASPQLYRLPSRLSWPLVPRIYFVRTCLSASQLSSRIIHYPNSETPRPAMRLGPRVAPTGTLPRPQCRRASRSPTDKNSALARAWSSMQIGAFVLAPHPIWLPWWVAKTNGVLCTDSDKVPDQYDHPACLMQTYADFPTTL